MTDTIRVAVVGSLVFDIAVCLDEFPRAHETILAQSATTSAGGKGLCQAVAASRLGAQVDVISLIGDDMFGDCLESIMDQEGLGIAHVDRHPSGTHLGIPMISPNGSNRIIGIPRASAQVDAGLVHSASDVLSASDILLLQGEVPLNACISAIEHASSADVVWNPAPAVFTLEQMLGGAHGQRIKWITPNEIEAEALTGIAVTDPKSAINAAENIRKKYPNIGVVITLGSQGSIAVWDEDTLTVPAFTIKAVDPTAAGDTFTAAFAVCIARKMGVAEALKIANAAGALAATRMGAVNSIPDSSEIKALIEEREQ